MSNIRWTVVKDYYKEGRDWGGPGNDMLRDTWVIVYGTKAEAEAAKARLEAGQDKSWYDPEGNEHAGYDAVLYVDQVEVGP